MSIVFRFSLKNSADQVTLSNTKVSELGLFKSNPNLLQRGRYTVTSNIRLETLEYFVTRLDGDAKPGGVTPDNAKELQLLCDELGFTGLNAEIRAVVGDEKSAMRRDLILMRDRMDRQEVVLERLQRQVLEIERQLKAQGPPGGEEKDTSELATEVSDLSTTVTTLATEVSDLAALTESIAEVLPEVEGKAGMADVKKLLDEKASAADLRALQEEVARLKRDESRRDTKPAPTAAPAPTPAPAPAPAARPAARPAPAPKRVEIPYIQAKPLSGILEHLTNECGGNVHDKKEVDVTASSVNYIYAAKNAADPRTHLAFWSNDEPNSWICYDFKDRRVTPTSYSLRSCASGPGSLNIKSWSFEGSNDGDTWEELDSQSQNRDLDDKSVTHNYPVTVYKCGKRYRYLRIVQNGRNHYGSHVLQLSAFEIFGVLYG